MKIEEQAIAMLREKGAQYFLIDGKIEENFSGCGCSSKGVRTISPTVHLGFGEPPQHLHRIQIQHCTVCILPDAIPCLSEETTIRIERLLFFRILTLTEAKPRVLR